MQGYDTQCQVKIPIVKAIRNEAVISLMQKDQPNRLVPFSSGRSVDDHILYLTALTVLRPNWDIKVLNIHVCTLFG